MNDLDRRIEEALALLDEAKHEIEQITGLVPRTWPMEAADAHAKITEAQERLRG